MHYTAEHARCAPHGWRPRPSDPECRRRAADLLAVDLSDWLTRRTGTPWSDKDAARLLFATACAEHDGYDLARRLEDGFSIKPDVELVELLDQWKTLLDGVVRKIESELVLELKIVAPFDVAAVALHGAVAIAGTAFRIPGDRNGLAAFIADGDLFGADGELLLSTVHIEDLELIGPASPGAEKLWTCVLARIEDDAESSTDAAVARLADMHLGQYDLRAVEMVNERGHDGMNAASAHLATVSDISEVLKEAIEGDDRRDVWTAALLLAAAYRRVAMSLGVPPEDASRIDEIVRRAEHGAVTAPHPVEPTKRPATVH